MKPLVEFSDEHLAERLQGLGKNLFLADGKLYLPSEVREAFLETRDEVLRRGMPVKLDVERWIEPSDPMPVFHSRGIVRYSKTRWLEQLRSGIVRFTSATKYAGLANVAQKDNEVQRTWHEPNTVLMINGVEYPASNMVLNQPVARKDGGSHIYHSLSFSLEESPKLQRAFEAEGYVVIYDYDEFYRVIADALRARSKDYQWSSGAVTYFDDRSKPRWSSVPDIVFSKSILFRYQQEVRMAVFNPPVEDERIEISVQWPAGLISPIRTFGRPEGVEVDPRGSCPESP